MSSSKRNTCKFVTVACPLLIHQICLQVQPGCIRCAFCHAQQVRGPLETHSESANIVNMKSSVPGETRPTLSLSGKQAADWFKEQGGKEVSSIKKPLLTTDVNNHGQKWAHLGCAFRGILVSRC